MCKIEDPTAGRGSPPSASSATKAGDKKDNPRRKDRDASAAKSATQKPIHVRLTLISLIEVLVGCAAASFAAGYLARNMIFSRYGFLLQHHGLLTTSTAQQENLKTKLPEIKLGAGKKAPHSKYTFKQFECDSAVSSNSILLEGDADDEVEEVCDKEKAEHHPESTKKEDEEMYEPSGQHMLIDIENVSPSFLNSEERLATAMIQLVQQSSLTLLSYHCHGLKPQGVSCVGVLLESHVSFHTWPAEGVITLDLFTCGSNSLLPLLPTLKELFGERNEELGDDDIEPNMIWRYKKRGFRSENDRVETDLHWLLGTMEADMEQVVSLESDLQQIDIYDMIEKGPGEDSNVVVQKDRMVFLDDILQSHTYGEAAYHEALVHPAMFAHDNPRRIAIIGGGEGATLREVLKHNTVEQVVMLEIDKTMVDVSKQFLQEWNDCSNLIGSSDSCFDDPRVTVYYDDAFAWFVQHFGPNVTIDGRFDVIIMDALDPSSAVEFSDLLYDNVELMDALSRALGDEGFFIAQVGEGDEMDDPPESYDTDQQFEAFLQGLQRVGFESIMDYDEAHGRLFDNWSFLLAMKDSSSRSEWLASESELQLKIKQRSAGTKNGESPFRFFDGATMMQYQFPSRLVEETWCRGEHQECGSGHGFNPEARDITISSFEIKQSSIKGAGRGVFSKIFIPKGSIIGLEDCVNGMFIPPGPLTVLEQSAVAFGKVSKFWKNFYWAYIDGYGWEDSMYGEQSGGVDPGILTFVNHGCDGTYNVGIRLNVTERTMELGRNPSEVYDDGNDIYDPFEERHFPMWDCGNFVALRDIQAGEELLDNYLVFGGSEDIEDWENNLRELKKMCSGNIGRVAAYEQSSD